MIGTAKEILTKVVELACDDSETLYELKKFRRKRSRDANNYYWALLTEIANVLRTSKEELHIHMLKEYGQITEVCVPSGFPMKGFIKYYEQDGVFYSGEQEFTSYKVFKPSSEMNSKEMSILIDGVISEAKALDIETLPPDEITRMLEAWHEKTNKTAQN